MDYYHALDYYTVLRKTVADVVGLLKATGFWFKEAEELFKIPIVQNVENIDLAFQRTLSHKDAYGKTYNSYLYFLIRQNEFQKAESVLQEAKTRGLLPIDTTLETFRVGSIAKKNQQTSFATSEKLREPRKAITDKIEECEAIVQKCRRLLNQVLAIESNNYIALYSIANLLKNSEELGILKRVVEACYDEQKKYQLIGEIPITSKVFISYNHHDTAFVEKLKSALKQENVGVIIDTESSKFGDSLTEFFEQAVRETDFTISVISRNSLKSPWVIAEALETLMHENVKRQNKLIPIFIDKSFLDEEYVFKIADGIDQAVTMLKELTNRAIERNLGTSNYDQKRQRLYTLRSHLDTIFERLNSVHVADFSSEQTFAENLPKLVEQVRNMLKSGQSRMIP